MSFENVEGHLFVPDLARRIRWVLAQMRSHPGVYLNISEGYRPVGQPADRYITNASQTSTGGSNQWFQYGRMNRGETPEAAYPGTSSHGRGEAVDWDTNHMGLRDHYMRLAGMHRNIPSETWHAVISGDPLVNLDLETVAVEPPAPKDVDMYAMTHPERAGAIVTATHVSAYRADVFSVLSRGLPVVEMTWPGGGDYDTVVREVWARSTQLRLSQAQTSAEYTIAALRAAGALGELTDKGVSEIVSATSAEIEKLIDAKTLATVEEAKRNK